MDQLTDDTVGTAQLVSLLDGTWRIRLAMDNGAVVQNNKIFSSRAEAEAALRAMNFRGPWING